MIFFFSLHSVQLTFCRKEIVVGNNVVCAGECGSKQAYRRLDVTLLADIGKVAVKFFFIAI